MDDDVRKLAELLGIDGSGLLKMIADRSEERFIKISDWIEDDKAAAIQKTENPRRGADADQPPGLSDGVTGRACHWRRGQGTDRP